MNEPIRRAARELLDVARSLVAKEAPTTLFERVFFEIRERARAFKEEQSQAAVPQLTKQLTDDLTALGLNVIEVNISLGQYRGSKFVTSAKVWLKFDPPAVDPDEKRITDLVAYLQSKYSPKFKVKGIDQGTVLFNVR